MPKGYWIAHVDVADPDAYKDYTTALACYESPEHRSAFALRKPPVAQGDVLVIEGYDGIQPA